MQAIPPKNRQQGWLLQKEGTPHRRRSRQAPQHLNQRATNGKG
ncbi:MAG: hypothetical protein PHE17_13915 [Thiothrix sp.]|nr:hypothetical protein [Thiothrix sp.]MDD5394104.1 hypothetical protein [Thiothrix sp.]